MLPLVLFTSVARHPAWRALEALDTALGQATTEEAWQSYAGALRAVIASGRPDPATVLAEALLESEDLGWLASTPEQGSLPLGAAEAAASDLARITAFARRDWRAEASPLLGDGLPRLAALTPEPVGDAWGQALLGLRALLRDEEPATVLRALLDRYREAGTGAAARYTALTWDGERLRGVASPAVTDASELIGLDVQLTKLFANTEAFLAGRPAHDTLLYGPRGSGKSTAIRGLLKPFAPRGLRLVEVASTELAELPAVLEAVRHRPQRFVLFVDDLSFDADDARYRPLKSLLEGGLRARPENVVLYATSNRRHLVKERFADRPDPLDDDVHAWDTQNEKLALADRFGLALTFPNASQRRYLDIVTALAANAGLSAAASDGLAQRAVRYADWGNGYSGRTARQFVDTLLQEVEN